MALDMELTGRHVGGFKLHQGGAGAGDEAVRHYTDLAAALDRIHRRYLEVVRLELDRMGVKDINPAQALMLVTIGDREVLVRDLINRGGYPASTASYNIKKLVDHGYLEQERAENDRRAVRLRITESGQDVVDRLSVLQERHAAIAARDPALADAMADATRTLRRLDGIWTDFMTFG
jgi:DNA-binding MarR family transcriptional regulator